MSRALLRLLPLVPFLALAGSSPADEVMAPVPPVQGIPGPLFFLTPTLSFVPKGTVRVTAGAGWFQQVSLPSGLEGDLSRLGIVRADLGFSSLIEVRVQGVFRQELKIDAERSHPVPPAEARGERAHDSGDFSVITIARLLPERSTWLPSLGMRIEAKLPNTDEQKGIGTNTTDVLLSVPMQRQFGHVFVATDFGLGILTEPTNAQSQNDVLLYGLATAWSVTPRVLLSGELNGRWAASGGNPGTGNRAVVQLGGAVSFGPGAVGVLLSRGLSGDTERFGVAVFVSYGFRVFRRIRAD